MHISDRTELVLAFHNHLPVGSSPDLFRRTYAQCYRPLLDLIAAHPHVHLALHHSGPLLEWLLREESQYLRDLKVLVDRLQVEVLGGAFYEPMLAMLSDDDKRGQIDMMNGFCDRQLQTRPQGLWLSERVWDPDLPRALVPAGVRYTFVDDNHLYSAGLLPQDGMEFSGYYVSERAGATLAVFPILRSLRYAIPFNSPEQVLDKISAQGHALRRVGRKAVLSYGDDGEKFGMWPGTEGMAQKGGWLDRFFQLLEARDEEFMCSTPPSVLARHKACGRVYMPAGAYEEMDAWSLPSASTRELQDLRAAARKQPQDSLLAKALPYLRGGLWSGFLAKYPEANLMHKRMVQISDKLAEAFVAQRAQALYSEDGVAADKLATAQRALYAGQCSASYWHGWYGGIYAPHLRRAAAQHLLEADVLLDELLVGEQAQGQFVCKDFDGDLADEVLLHNGQVNAYVCPHPGGTLFAFDHRRSRSALLTALSRRPEAYSDKIPEDLQPVYDDAARQAFVDRFYAKDAVLENVANKRQTDLVDLSAADYRIIDLRRSDRLQDAVELVLRCETRLHGALGESRLSLTKRFVLPDNAAAVQVVYSISHEGGAQLDTLFAPEINWGLLAEAQDCQVQVADKNFALESTHNHLAQELAMLVKGLDFRTVLSAAEARSIWQYPLFSVSRAQQGFVRQLQGLAVHPVFEISLKAGEIKDFELVLGFESFA